MTVLALALGATGCTGSKESPTPTSPSDLTKSATPTPSPSETAKVAPVMPAELQDGKATKANAELFVKYYFDVVNYVQATGDTKPLRAISMPGCEPCQNALRNIESRVARGGSTEGGVLTIRQIKGNAPVKVGKATLFLHSVSLDQTAAIVRNARNSKKVVEYPATAVKFRLNTIRQSGTWAVSDLAVIS